MRCVLWFSIAISIGACDPPRQTYEWRVVTLPTGQVGAAVSCRQNIGVCYERAGRACPLGYDIIDHDRQAAVVGSGRAIGNAGRWDSELVFSGTLLIRCH
jgi:hypothetical protein